jgi:hypothetical protein
MRKRFAIALLAFSGAAAASEQREPVWMGDNEIKAAFDGRTIDGQYGNGLTFTESYLANGRVTYVDPLKSMGGRWSVVNRTFCTLYDTFPTGGCFKVTKVSANCFEFYFLTSSEREAALPDPGKPSWTARGWHKGVPATCDDKPSV